MGGNEDPAAIARAIIDSDLYMALGTSDAGGRPWVSPVYYAAEG
jgi:pyridoxamine 5'-phosphate oxidase-like protein